MKHGWIMSRGTPLVMVKVLLNIEGMHARAQGPGPRVPGQARLVGTFVHHGKTSLDAQKPPKIPGSFWNPWAVYLCNENLQAIR